MSETGGRIEFLGITDKVLFAIAAPSPDAVEELVTTLWKHMPKVRAARITLGGERPSRKVMRKGAVEPRVTYNPIRMAQQGRRTW